MEAALTAANRWLDEVRGVHLVGSGRDDCGDFILVFVDGPVEAYEHLLPERIEGMRVLVERSDLAEPH